MKMLDFKICPRCKSNTADENDVCPYCGYNFKIASSHLSEFPSKTSAQEIKPITEKKGNPNLFRIFGILFLIILVFLIFIPTKTIITDVEVSYLGTETYTDQEPYTEMEITYVKETWQEVHTTNVGYESSEGYYYSNCGSGCTCSHYTSNPNTIPSYYCDKCSCSNSGVYEQSRTDPKYQWVTKYREVSKTRNVTKTRIEPGPVEVNWIIGFNTPFKFHLI